MIRGVRIPVRTRDFFLFQKPDLRSIQLPPVPWVPIIKRLELEVNHSSPPSAEVKEWVELYLYRFYIREYIHTESSKNNIKLISLFQINICDNSKDSIPLLFSQRMCPFEKRNLSWGSWGSYNTKPWDFRRAAWLKLMFRGYFGALLKGWYTFIVSKDKLQERIKVQWSIFFTDV